MSRYNPANKPTIGGAPQQKGSIIDLVNQFAPEIMKVLPKHLTPDRMTRVILTEIRKNPKLAECSQSSLFSSIIQCVQLGLEPGSGLGHAYLVPYGRECTFICGYQGMIELAERNGLAVYAKVAYEHDIFIYEDGLDPKLIHKPMMGQSESRGEILAAYAIAVYKDGRKKFEVLSVGQIEDHRKKSKFPNGGPWKDHYAEMAKKTAIRVLFKMLPKSPLMAKLQEIETAIEIGENNSEMIFEGFKDEVKPSEGFLDTVMAKNEEPSTVET